MDRPFEETLSGLGLSDAIEAVLRGQAVEGDPLDSVYRLVQAYEVADWSSVDDIGSRLGVPVPILGEVYCEAAGWAGQVMDPAPAAQPIS